MKRVFLLAILYLGSPAYADCPGKSVVYTGWFQDFYAIIGYDLYGQHVLTNSDFTRTKGILPEDYLGGDFYVGPRFDTVGIYFGWEQTFQRIKHSDVDAGTTLGTARLSGPARLKTSVKAYGPYIEIARYWTFTPKVELFISGGLGFIKPSIDIESISGAGIGDSFEGHTRVIPRIGIGGQRLFCDWFGLRLKFEWQATSNARIQQRSTNVKYKLFTDSLKINLGIYGSF